MPAEAVAREPGVRPAPRPPAAAGGFVVFHPNHRGWLAQQGCDTAAALLGLPGEVVSGHPRRHVMRVELGGRVLYLKREHRVTWRERLRNRLGGYGWASKSAREADTLAALDAAGLPAPAWLAHGEDGNGRAFLLLAELDGRAELRHLLGVGGLSAAGRRRLAERVGRAVAGLHAAGFDTPDLTAKHLFVDPESFEVTVIDWQNARRPAPARTFAALHASLADTLAGARDRLRCLWAYCRATGAPFAVLAREAERLAEGFRGRRSFRDQRQPAVTGSPQRLVWLADEAVCAVPSVAAVWPTPAVAPPFYGDGPRDRRRTHRTGLGWLVRGESFDPFGRLVAYLRGRPWRSPEATVARVLFHLERYGVPAPRLLAFGQRLTGPAAAESFVLYDPPAAEPLDAWAARRDDSHEDRNDILETVGTLLRQFHAAGCRLTGPSADEPLLWVNGRSPLEPVLFGAVRAVRIVKRVTDRGRRQDLKRVFAVTRGILRAADRVRVLRGYLGEKWADPACRRCYGRLALPA